MATLPQGEDILALLATLQKQAVFQNLHPPHSHSSDPESKIRSSQNYLQAMNRCFMSDSEESIEGNSESSCSSGACETTRETAREPGGCCVEALCLNANGTVQLKAKGTAQKTNAGFPKQVHVAILPPGANQIPTSPPKSTTVSPIDGATGAWNFSWPGNANSIGPAECNRINYVVFWFEYRFENPMTGQVITFYSLEARSVIPACRNLPACLPPIPPTEDEQTSAEPTAPLVALEGGPVPSPKGKKRAKKK